MLKSFLITLLTVFLLSILGAVELFIISYFGWVPFLVVDGIIVFGFLWKFVHKTTILT